MSTARRPQTDGLTERVNETMQVLLRCYCAESGFDWASLLSLVEFWYNSTVSESTQQSPFEALYGYQPSNAVDRLLPLTRAPVSAVDRLTYLKDTRELIK